MGKDKEFPDFDCADPADSVARKRRDEEYARRTWPLIREKRGKGDLFGPVDAPKKEDETDEKGE